jgi:hypothetical protein
VRPLPANPIWLRPSAEASLMPTCGAVQKVPESNHPRNDTLHVRSTPRLRDIHRSKIHCIRQCAKRNHCDMPLSSKLDRKLHAAEESSDGEDYYEVTDRSSSESIIETGAGGGEVISSGNEDDAQQDSQDEAMVSCRGLAPRTSVELTSASQMHPTTTR